MAGTEDITLRVALDDRQAKAGLDALRGSTDALAQAAAGAVDGGAGGGGLSDLGSSFEGLTHVAGPSAQAISRIATRLSNISPAVSSALGALGTFGTALASGSPWAVAIIGAGAAIGYLIHRYDESSKAAEEAAKKHAEAAEKIIRSGLGPLEAATLEFNKAQKELRLSKILTGEDTDSINRAVSSITLELERLQAQIGAAERDFKKFKGEAVRGIRTGESVEEYKAAKVLAEEQAKATEANISLLRQAFNIRAQTIPLVQESVQAEIDLRNKIEDKQKAERDHEKAIQDSKKQLEDQLKMQQEAADFAKDYVAQRRKQIMDETAAIGPTAEMSKQAQVERARKAAQEAEKEHTRILQEESKKQQEASDAAAKKRQEDAQTTAGYVSAFTGIIVGQSQQLIDDLIMGQEKAFERFFAGVMKQAGTVLIGKGIELVGSGTANLLLGNPAGAAQLAVGGSMIAGGVTLGGIGAGIERGLMGGSAPTGAGTAGPSPATTATPMGAGRISSGGRDGGGPMQEAITYVFNAPVFGDQNRSAKQVAMLQRRARRDLLLA